MTNVTSCVLQSAAITNLLTKFVNGEYQFMLDPEGNMILAYIDITELGPASGKRRQLLQTTTTATTNIPLPAGLDETTMTKARTAAGFGSAMNIIEPCMHHTLLPVCNHLL